MRNSPFNIEDQTINSINFHFGSSKKNSINPDDFQQNIDVIDLSDGGLCIKLKEINSSEDIKQYSEVSIFLSRYEDVESLYKKLSKALPYAYESKAAKEIEKVQEHAEREIKESQERTDRTLKDILRESDQYLKEEIEKIEGKISEAIIEDEEKFTYHTTKDGIKVTKNLEEDCQ